MILLVNFGGPRELDEVEPFLTSLLTDRDLIRTRFPTFFHNWLFGRVARKRAGKIREDYREIGGRSPIYFDTENLGQLLAQKLKTEVFTFHRYLPATHAKTFEEIRGKKVLKVLPMFPQFCTATTGSIARIFAKKCPPGQLRWIKSYATHPAFVTAFQERIRTFLQEKKLCEEETFLLFSAHGVPKAFIDEGDSYELECQQSFEAIMKAFSKGKLAFQSKFGKDVWIGPATDELCQQVDSWREGRKNIVFVPLSFTSDHIETLFEIEKLYLPIIRGKGLNAYRCPALNLEPYWIDALALIAEEQTLFTSRELVR